MNIKEAKEEIKRIVEVYLEKNTYGEYMIPYSKQRPIFLVGAPGIGKTAIMEQIAQELDLPLLSYSMTHHTRQSAIGLPFITEKEYNGELCSVSEYTVSEIIASVYEMIEKSQKKEGILFLDEINCVSETLAPSMLLFLQYKVFGNRQMPEGWIIVTAGNPPQYNKSVREFDVATKDRLRCMEITEDLNVWKEYAYTVNIHSSITSFLEINKEWFYRVRETVDGSQYVTARGWEDLSQNIFLYEKKSFPVNRTLVEQFITDEEIARKFCIYYDLYQKYRSDYQVAEILDGKESEALQQKAAKARFDERISLISLLLERLHEEIHQEILHDRILSAVVLILRKLKNPSLNQPMEDLLSQEICIHQEELKRRCHSHGVSADEMLVEKQTIALLEDYAKEAEKNTELEKKFTAVKSLFRKSVKKHEKQIQADQLHLEHAFSFIQKIWGTKQEMVLFLTELTTNASSLEFIQKWGCESYYQYNQELLIYDVKEKLHQEVLQLEL